MGHDTNTGDDDEHMGDDSNNSGDDDDFTNVEEDYGGCTYGLAYDPISHDYKVFMISMFRPDDNEIFTLKNNASWRIIDHKISGRTDSSMLTGGEYLPFVHGAFHWIGMLSRFCVVSFNISDEMYGEISLPAIVCCLTLSKSEVEVEVDVGVSLLGEMLSVYCKDENFFILWDTRIFDCPSNSYPENGITGIIAYCSCDGLVLIRIWSDPNAEQSSILVLWNPSTRESVLLPKSSLSSTVDDDIDVGSTYGLPYDSTSDDYKVLEIDMSGHNNNEILSLKNCSWSIIDHKTSGRTDARQHSCLVVNIDHKVLRHSLGVQINSRYFKLQSRLYRDRQRASRAFTVRERSSRLGPPVRVVTNLISKHGSWFQGVCEIASGRVLFMDRQRASRAFTVRKCSSRPGLPVRVMTNLISKHGSWSQGVCEIASGRVFFMDDMYGEIPLPDIICSLTPSKFRFDVDDHVGVSMLRGMLGVYYKDKDENLFNLWVMKNYGVQNSWMKLFTIPIGTNVLKIIPMYMYSDNEVLLCFVKEGLVRAECVYRVISCGSFGLSDRM
ncbi:hypothetical protein T459_07195 [Capsicum annuum]|uniref:F-box associated beta-propeller type 3 domain-containing protein n=1 Tax=Capsicum annuum TaxID=4072 RepID=A0A2G3ACV5_CAPAN|nr:hypothetical protein T459_07195 [Capsicum annuum]